MRAPPFALLVAAVAVPVLAAESAPGSSREIDNVAAFARLYGVVRYFYPSDAAADLVWNRFAVHGVAQVRPARDTAALREALAALFAPLGPGIEIGPSLPAPRPAASSSEPLVAWRYLGAGFSTRGEHSAYQAKRTRASMAAGTNSFVTLMLLRFAPPPSGPANVELFADAAPTAGAHADFDLGAGLFARVPLALTDSQARAETANQGRLDALTSVPAAVPSPGETPDLDQRLADLVVAWSVFRHFYPYWMETGVDWDACLRPRLESARAAKTRAAQGDAIRGLVADARDGHGGVTDPLDKKERAVLPVQLSVIDGRVVVSASDAPSEAPVGAVVRTIDGVSATDRLAQAMRLQSGTTQWRQVCAVRKLASGPKGATAILGLDSGAGPREVSLSFGATLPPPESRPEPVAELEPEIWYVDLTRATMAAIKPRLDTLAAARVSSSTCADTRATPAPESFPIS